MSVSGFTLHRQENLAYYSCAALDRLPRIRHGFSARHGGLNLGFAAWDSADNVAANRRRFLAALRIPTEGLATVSQIHSAECHIIKDSVHQWDPRTRGDALLTCEPGIAAAVLVADCFPVLVADPRSGAVAAVHAGWRGTLGRILSKTFETMHRSFGVDARDALVAIGPGIRKCCLEVGPEVDDAFKAAFPGRPLSAPRGDRHMLDLPLTLAAQLSEAGVPAHNVFDLGLCTRCQPADFFSYRAEGKLAGRLMAVIARVS
jgi:YfiH family protein